MNPDPGPPPAPQAAIRGLGIDLVDVPRVRALLERHGDRFKERTFTAGEIAYCEGCADPAIHYAARFAAKEAVAKALGAPAGMEWHHCIVSVDTAGRPSLELSDTVLATAEALGITDWHISLTHDSGVAIAYVIAESRP